MKKILVAFIAGAFALASVAFAADNTPSNTNNAVNNGNTQQHMMVQKGQKEEEKEVQKIKEEGCCTSG